MPRTGAGPLGGVLGDRGRGDLERGRGRERERVPYPWERADRSGSQGREEGAPSGRGHPLLGTSPPRAGDLAQPAADRWPDRRGHARGPRSGSPAPAPPHGDPRDPPHTGGGFRLGRWDALKAVAATALALVIVYTVMPHHPFSSTPVAEAPTPAPTAAPPAEGPGPAPAPAPVPLTPPAPAPGPEPEDPLFPETPSTPQGTAAPPITTTTPPPTAAPTPAPTAPPTPKPTQAAGPGTGGTGGTPVERHGWLSVKGSQIVNERGEPVRLAGMSLFWSQWMGKFWNEAAVKWLVDDWHVEIVRAAMGVDREDGYMEHHDTEKEKLMKVVDAAISKGVYVIIDWHEENADKHGNLAQEFFTEMAQKYGQTPNVLFETFNEPTSQKWSEEIKPYHEGVVSAIRQHAPKNLIILGTRTWSQGVDEASQDPVAGENLAYTLHFYAGSHKEELRNAAKAAMANNAAVFVTEWGTTSSTGDGALDLEETKRWLKFLEEHHISSCNWSIADKEESSAALRPGAASTGGWQEHQLTESGAFVRNYLRGALEL